MRSRVARLRSLWIVVAALACWTGGPLLPSAQAQSGINISKDDAMKSDSADQWLTDTVKGIREKVRRKNGAPNELAGAFIGTPFSDVFDEVTRQGSMSNGCGFAAGVVAGGAVRDFEQFGSGAVGAAINTVKGAVDLTKSVYDAAKSVATAGGSTVVEKVGEAAVDAVKDAGKDAAKDIGKDVASGTAKDIIKGNKPDIGGKIGEAVQKKVDDAKEFVEGIKDYFKDGPIIFAYSGTKAGCTVVTLWVWDEKQINLYVRGTCDCNAANAFVMPKGNKAELTSFFFHLQADTIRTNEPGILKFSLGTVHLVDKAFECGCQKPKTATGYQPATPAACPRCQILTRQIADLEKDIAKATVDIDAARAAKRQALMGNNDELAEQAQKKMDKATTDKATYEKELERPRRKRRSARRSRATSMAATSTRARPESSTSPTPPTVPPGMWLGFVARSPAT
jgi:hypothetical protein